MPFTNFPLGDAIVQGCRRLMLLTGLGLAALAGGCQGTGGSASSGDRGPSPMFGQNYVPQQSEPPVVDAGPARKSAASDAGELREGEDSTVAARRKPRWLGGSDAEPAPRKTLPVSTRTDSLTDDDPVQ